MHFLTYCASYYSDQYNLDFQKFDHWIWMIIGSEYLIQMTDQMFEQISLPLDHLQKAFNRETKAFLHRFLKLVEYFSKIQKKLFSLQRKEISGLVIADHCQKSSPKQTGNLNSLKAQLNILDWEIQWAGIAMLFKISFKRTLRLAILLLLQRNGCK